MYYITVKASPKYHQMTFEELLFGMNYAPPIVQNETNTRTYEVGYISDRFLNGFSVEPLIKMLEEFNASTENLRSQDRLKLYYHFCIPKKSGGLRPIDAPVPELMEALRALKNMFELCLMHRDRGQQSRLHIITRRHSHISTADLQSMLLNGINPTKANGLQSLTSPISLGRRLWNTP